MTMQQITNTILMIRPINFRMNEQTTVDNYYQKGLDNISPKVINSQAQEEFDVLVDKLNNIGVHVVVISDTNKFDTPDSVFPNNWVSFHSNGIVGLYPMFAENRRFERREDVFLELENQGFLINNIVDYTSAESEEVFLEGTGSLLLDRKNRKAYCALSARADEELFIEFCEDFEYTPIVFHAKQTVRGKREAIYHTNVMMCLGETFAVICLESLDDKKERKNVLNHLREDGKEVIIISETQVNSFAGNMIQVRGKDNQPYLVMSQAALDSLSEAQIRIIKSHCDIISSSLDTIEACGGGSARCMMAEVFLPRV